MLLKNISLSDKVKDWLKENKQQMKCILYQWSMLLLRVLLNITIDTL